jgi:membrane protein DedA with SNARE-associated domain
MEIIIDKWGPVLRLTKQDLHKADAWFVKYGVWTVFFCRCIPLIRSLISIPAGMTRMNFSLFVVLTLLGSLVWNTALVYMGTVVGHSWESIVTYIDIYSNIVYAGLAIFFILFLMILMKRRKKIKRL